MPHDLTRFELSDMTVLGADLRRLSDGAESMEQVAQRMVRLLRDEFIDETDGRPSCPLVRLYRTLPFDQLGPDLQEFGRAMMAGHELAPRTRCLTLLATAGEREEWNSRHLSANHRTIPLPSEDVVHSIPMISQLLVQLGMDVASFVQSDLSVVLEQEQRTYNVFFVPDAVGSPYIPAQEDFVLPLGIRSVLGFGGLLTDGDVFSLLMFTRQTIARSTADIFRNAALNAKVALLEFVEGPIFSPPATT